MAQFDKNQRIRFKLNDEASIVEALKQYKYLLQNDEVMVDRVYDIDFVYVENDEDHPLLLEHGDLGMIEKMRRFSESDYYEQRNFNSTGSEGLFFSHCLKNPNLKSEIVETVQEIVNYVRRHNDTWEMWSDDCAVFGVDPVYMLAETYPEYTYLLGAYVIPYWDTEHANYVMCSLEHVYMDRGFTDDLLKAFCYCDNGEGRSAMILNGWEYDAEDAFDLEAYFREQPDRYDRFKTLMKERFKEQPYIQYSDHDHTDRPLEGFYRTILGSSADNDEDDYEEDLDLEQTFIEDSYDNEAHKLHQEIEAYIGEPLTAPYKDPYAEFDDDDDDEDSDGESIWEDFFLNGFEQGEEMWNYIMYGEDDSILDEIEPTDLIQLAKSKHLRILKKFKWFIGEFDTLEGEFHNIFQDFLYEYYDEDEALQNNGMIIKVNGHDSTGREAVTCALDIFYKLMGQPTFSYDLFDIIVSTKVMTASAFMDRYDRWSEASMKDLTQLIGEFSGTPEVFGPQLDRIYEMMKEHRSEALSLFEGKSLDTLDEKAIVQSLSKDILIRPTQVALYQRGLNGMDSSLVLATYILYKDYQDRLMDDLSGFLIQFVDENLVKSLINAIEENSNLTPEEFERVKKYIKGKPMPPKALMMKAMMGKEALTKEEKTLLNPKFEPVKLEEAAELLRAKLHQEADNEDPQIHYELFDEINDDYLCGLLVALYLGGLRFNLPSSMAYNNAYRLLFELAPIKVIKSTAYLYHSSYRTKLTDVDSWYDFERDIRKITKDKSKFLAWEILDGESERYEAIVEAYIEDEQDSGFSFITVETREAIEKSLQLLPFDEQLRFYEEVSDNDPDMVIKAPVKIFHQSIPAFVKDTHVDRHEVPENEIQAISNDLIRYVEGEMAIDGLAHTTSILKVDRSSLYFTNRLWNLNDKRRERLFAYLFQFGESGIWCGYDHHEVDAVDYLEILLNHKVSHEHITAFLIKCSDFEAFDEYLESYNPSEQIKSMNVDDRMKALWMAASSSSGREFIQAFVNDPSNRVSDYAKSLLEN